MAKTFSREEIAKHATQKDLWIVFHNKVYSLADYVEEHPGGIPLLLEVGGQDGTQAFEDVGHSDDAREMLEPFLIGEVASEDKHEEVVAYKPQFEAVTMVNDLRQPGGSKLGKVFKGTVKIFITGGAIYAGAKYVRENPALFAVFSIKHLQAMLPKSLPKSFGSGGFWVGFGTSTVVNALIVTASLLRLEKLMDISKDFRKYASRSVAPYEIYAPKKKVAEPVLHPQQYRKFPLVKKDKLSPNTYRFVFALPKPTDVLGLPTGQHVAIRATIDGKVVSRSYTPTSNDSDLGRIEMVIKVYPDGLLTNYLANLKLNDQVEFRGPKGAMKYHRDLCKSLGMIAGGTGITPMYQLIRAICEDPKDTTQVSLLYANQTEADILLRDELDAWARKFPQKFKVWYVLDKPSQDWQYGKGFITKDLIKERFAPASPDSKVHLCGPPGMIKAMTKNLVELGFTAPGTLSKATDQIFLF